MLRKPGKHEPLPAFGSDDDDSASTGEYRAVLQDGKSPFDRPGLPRFEFSEERPRFASLESSKSGASGGGALPRFPSMPDAHEVSPPRSASRPLPAPSSTPRARTPEPLPRYPSIPDADVAATLEKQPVSAQAANRILAQLDRKPVRADSTSEVMLEDVLEEVYAEPAPSRGSSSAASSRDVSSRPNEPARSSPSSAPSRRSVSEVPSAPASASSSQRSSRPPPSPVATARALLEQAATEIAFPPPELPRSSPPPAMPAAPVALAPQASAPAFAPAVPPGYVLVPQAALAVPMAQAAPPSGYLAPVGMGAPGMPVPQAPPSNAYAPGSSPLAYATASESYTRPLPVEVPGSEARSGGLLSKVVAGGLILGLSALAGGAASVWLLPQKDAPLGTAPPAVNATSASATSPGAAPGSASSAAPPAVPGATDASVVAPAQMVPASQGWPLAPATVPPGAASLAPPPPSSSPSGSVAPAASGEKSAAVSSATSAGAAPPVLSETSGRLTFPAARQGHRVWVDGAVMGTSPTPIVVKCGKHTVRLGSSGSDRTVDVPCGGEFLVR